jgi:cobalt/nickel transport system permease protein
MALPALLCYLLFRWIILRKSSLSLPAAFACGFFSVFLSGIMVGGALVFSNESFFKVAALVLIAHLPVMIIEGLITCLCMAFLKKVQPALLQGYT